MKPKLIILTDIYPFGNGEVFVGNELQILKEYFTVSLITDSFTQGPNRLEHDSSIRVIRVPKQVWSTPDSRRKAFYRCLTTPELRRELFKVMLRYKTKARPYIRNIYTRVAMGEAYYSYLTDNRLLDHNEPAIIYSFWNTYKLSPFLVRSKKHPLWAIVSRIHSVDFYQTSHPLKRQPLKSLNVRLDRLYFLSQSAFEYYTENFGRLPKHCGKVLPLGTFNAYGVGKAQSPHDAFVIVTCSRVTRVKRLERVIEALALIDDIPIRWVHFGDGELMDEIKAMIRERIRRPNITATFMGDVENPKVLRYYHDFGPDCFLNVSDVEGTPVSVMEALSFGMPVISFAVGSIPEMLKDTKNLLLNRDSAPEALAAALRTVYHLDDKERETIRRENRELWEARYNADTNGRRFALDLLSLQKGQNYDH